MPVRGAMVEKIGRNRWLGVLPSSSKGSHAVSQDIGEQGAARVIRSLTLTSRPETLRSCAGIDRRKAEWVGKFSGAALRRSGSDEQRPERRGTRAREERGGLPIVSKLPEERGKKDLPKGNTYYRGKVSPHPNSKKLGIARETWCRTNSIGL